MIPIPQRRCSGVHRIWTFETPEAKVKTFVQRSFLDGICHAFCTETNEDGLQFASALIELPDGSMISTDVTNITFTTPSHVQANHI